MTFLKLLSIVFVVLLIIASVIVITGPDLCHDNSPPGAPECAEQRGELSSGSGGFPSVSW